MTTKTLIGNVPVRIQPRDNPHAICLMPIPSFGLGQHAKEGPKCAFGDGSKHVTLLCSTKCSWQMDVHLATKNYIWIHLNVLDKCMYIYVCVLIRCIYYNYTVGIDPYPLQTVRAKVVFLEFGLWPLLGSRCSQPNRHAKNKQKPPTISYTYTYT